MTDAPEVPLSLTPTRRRVPAAIAIAGTLVAVLVGAGLTNAWHNRSISMPRAAAPARLAVLPFDNTGDSTDAYLADGMTDGLRTKLAAVPGIEVIAPASAARYGHSEETPAAIGRALHVRYLLRGRVQRAGGRLAVEPELFDAASAGETWSAPYSARVADVFAIQASIATKVASALGVTLDPGDRGAIDATPTSSLDAWEGYVKGQSTTDPRRAIAAYERAVAVDPAFALAWARLSTTLSALWVARGRADSALARAAHKDAERALAIAPTLGPAHGAMALYDATIAGDNDAALREYEAALRYAPNDAEILVASAQTLRSVGHWEQALARLDQAERMEPFGSAAARVRGTTLLRLRRYPEARQALDLALARAPGSADAIVDRALVELCAGDREAARAVLRAGAQVTDSAALYAYASGVLGAIAVMDSTTWRYVTTLGPRAFGGNRAAWASAIAADAMLLGDSARMRAFADSARGQLEGALRAAPESPALHAEYGLALAYLGRTNDAAREGERAVTLAPPPENTWQGPTYQQTLARIYLRIGARDKALDLIESLLKGPALLSPGWLRVDPVFDQLRAIPRFRRLAAGH